MHRDPPPIGRAVGDDQARDDPTCGPCSRRHSASRVAALHVQGAQQLLDVHDHRLRLAYQNGRRARVERDQVNASTVSIVVETDLRGGLPPGALKKFGGPRPQGGVVGVTEAHELKAALAGIPGDGKVHRPADAPHRSNGQPIRSSTLEQADQARTHPGARGQVRLAPAAPMPQHANRPPERRVIHARQRGTARLLRRYGAIITSPRRGEGVGYRADAPGGVGRGDRAASAGSRARPWRRAGPPAGWRPSGARGRRSRWDRSAHSR